MERKIELTPINEAIEDVRKQAKNDIDCYVESSKRNVEETIKRIELTRQGIALLDGAGVNVSVSGRGAFCNINLGFFSNSKKGNRELSKAVRKIRVALGCPLKNNGRELEDGKKRIVRFNLRPEAFPNIHICFDRRLRKDAKCRIVTRRGGSYKTLVCEV